VADSARNVEDGFHEIQLTGKQLVFVFMATTVVVVVVFLLGVLVGRGVGTERAAADPAGDSAPPGEVLPPADMPPPPSSSSGQPSPSTGEDLTYAQRLQGDDPTERLTPGASAPSAETTAEPPTIAETEPADPPPAQAATPTPATRAETTDGWVVQVAALRDRNAANAVVRKLSAKGYRAFLVHPAAGTPAPSYRVRVGPFPDRGEAEQVSRRLEREEQFKPFITR
jgi:cell division septation protein DedD